MRFARTLVAALALHATLPFAARLAPTPRVTAAVEPIIPIEIDMTPLPVPQRVVAPAPVDTPHATDDSANPAREKVLPKDPSGAREAPVAATEGPTPDSTATPIAPPPGTANPNEEYGPPTARKPNDGVPGVDTPIWAVPGVIGVAPTSAPAPTTAGPPPRTNPDQGGIVIRDALKTQDKAIGIDLPGAGVVASTIRDVVQSSDAPMVSKASFQVRIGPNGNVLGVTVGSASTGSSEVWQRMASAIAAALKAKTLALPSDYAKGATITVSVSSDATMPSGGSGGVTAKGAGIGFDLSDVGAHKRRVVRTTFTATPTR